MAAGMGTRFGNKTEFTPKGFIEVDGTPMIIRSIENLIENGIERIIIGTGYLQERFQELALKYPQIECCFSEKYAITNSLWTLCNCSSLIKGNDFILLESDLVYEREAIKALINNKYPDILLASDERKFQDQYFVDFDKNGYLKGCSTERCDLTVKGEFVGIHKLSFRFYKALCSYYNEVKDEYPKLGYEYGLLYIAKHQIPLYVLKIPNLKWYEIDDNEDLFFVENSKIIS